MSETIIFGTTQDTIVVSEQPTLVVDLGAQVPEVLRVLVEGPAGDPGADGAGVPPGGVAGEILTKNSATNNDTSWAPAPNSSPFVANGTNDAIIPVDTQDSFIVGSDRMNNDSANSTKRSRTFFNKIKGAFRAGEVNSTQWDDANVGGQSFATGWNTRASGQMSQAHGNTTIASASYSSAEGSGTTASGSAAHAEGNSTQATASFTHSEGSSTVASGTAAHAEGQSTAASGVNSHAEGHATTASGTTSHAEGYGTTASAMFSHAEGHSALASRFAQLAKASGQFANPGDAQACNMVLRKITTNAAAGVLAADTSAPLLVGAQTNVLTIAASRAYQLEISTVARRTNAQGEAAGWTWNGLINRDSTGNAFIIGTPIIAAWGTAGAAAWDVTVSINTTDATNNYVAITVTGEAGKTIRWVANVEWTEVAG